MNQRMPPANRVLDALTFYVEQDIQYRVQNGLRPIDDTKSKELQLQYYQDLRKQYRRGTTKPEKATRRFLNQEIRRIKVQLKPTAWNYVRYGVVARFLRDVVTGTRKQTNWHKTELKAVQKKTGHEQNVILLSDALKKAGFTQNVDHLLNKMMSQDATRFHIRYKDVRNPDVDYVLHFNRQPDSLTYNFTKFEAAPQPHTAWNHTQRDVPWKTFDQTQSEHLSASQAAKLVQGKAICIDGKEQWITLDRTQPLTAYREMQFDLHKALKELPMPTLTSQTLEQLANALKAGNAKEVKLMINDQLQRVWLEASPDKGQLRILDSNKQLIDKETLLKPSQQQAQQLFKLSQTPDRQELRADKGLRRG